MDWNKQAGNGLLSFYMHCLKKGFQQATLDLSLFIKHYSDFNIELLVYVDAMILASNNQSNNST